MLSMDEVEVVQFYANQQMPHGMSITHRPTGVRIEGNCKMEQNIPRLQDTLMSGLAQAVMREHGPMAANKAEMENHSLKQQLMLMQAQINQLIAGKVFEAPAKEAKEKKGWSPERKAEAAQRMREMKARQKQEKSEESRLIAEQMRPPTDMPVDLPKTSHGGTVAKSSVEWIKP